MSKGYFQLSYSTDSSILKHDVGGVLVELGLWSAVLSYFHDFPNRYCYYGENFRHEHDLNFVELTHVFYS